MRQTPGITAFNLNVFVSYWKRHSITETTLELGLAFMSLDIGAFHYVEKQ